MTTVDTATERTLHVPGATLSYEVAGKGPVLLLIPGGAADAGLFWPVVGPLAEHYTVVTYDPRGISRSRIEGKVGDVSVETHADDASRLLAEIGSEPAFVLGSSGGAVIGLALAQRHPERVRTLVAHEPPLLEVLPAGSAQREAGRTVYDVYQREGAGPAMGAFLAATGMRQPAPPADISPEMAQQMAAGMARMQGNVEFFLAHYLLPITGYQPDFAALKSGAPRVVVGVGAERDLPLAVEAALALAKRLGTPPVDFPGGHSGYATHPQAFADKLNQVLRAA